MAEKTWDAKPQMKTGTILGTKIHNFYDIEEMDAWLENLKAHYETIEKQAETLRFLFGDKGVKTANLEKIQIWREKADLWDQYAIYDNDKEEEILVKDLITAYEKLEAVKTYATKLRDQAKKTDDIFERGFCTGIADGLEKILEGEV